MMKKLIWFFCFCTLILGGVSVFAQTTASVPSAAVSSLPVQAAVAPFGEKLFSIYGNLGSVTAEKRAQIITANIKKMRKDLLYKPDLLLITSEDGTQEISYLGDVVLAVTEKQAAAEGKSKEALAQDYREIIISALAKARSGSIWLLALRQVGLAVLILAVTVLCVKYVNFSYRRLQALVWKKKDKTGETLNKIIDVNKQTHVLLLFMKAVRFAIVAVLVYICCLAFLALFPETRWLAGKLVSFIVVPVKTVTVAIWNYLPNLFMIAVILVFFRLVSKLLRVLADRVGNGSLNIQGFHADWAMPTYHLIWVVLLIFTVIFIFPLLPRSNSDVFKGISVFLGVLLSLGSTSIINNVVSGFVITYMRPFKVGDQIKMGEHLGTVIEKSTLVTRVRTPKNEIITIPNSTIMTANTVNYSNSASTYGLILHARLTVGYEIEWRKVHTLLQDAAARTSGLLKDPKPFVLQLSLDDFYVMYEVNAYTDNAAVMAGVYSELNQNIQDVFNEAGVELLSPHVNSVRDASAISTPKQYLRPGFEKAPPFYVSIVPKTEQPGERAPEKNN